MAKKPIKSSIRNTMRSLYKAVHLYFLVTAPLIIVSCIILYAFGKIQPQVATIFSGLSGLIGFILGQKEHIQPHFNRAHQGTGWIGRIFVGLLSAATVIILIIGVFGLPISNIINGLSFIWIATVPPSTTLTPTPTLTIQPSVVATTTPIVPSPTPSVATPVHLHQDMPGCSDSAGAWSLSSGYDNCELMELPTSPEDLALDGEVELTKVKGHPYILNAYTMQVQVKFPAFNGTPTWAALHFPLQMSSTTVGSYILMLNPSGEWDLEQTLQGTKVSIKQGHTSIDPQQGTKIAIEFQQKTLTVQINDLPVISYGVVPGNNTVSSPNLVGLEGKSTVLYSKFQLDSL